MNAERRRALKDVIAKLQAERIKIAELKDQERDYLVAGMPQNMRGSVLYTNAEETVVNLERCLVLIDDIIQNINYCI